MDKKRRTLRESRNGLILREMLIQEIGNAGWILIGRVIIETPKYIIFPILPFPFREMSQIKILIKIVLNREGGRFQVGITHVLAIREGD